MSKFFAILLVFLLALPAYADAPKMLDSGCDVVAGLIADDVSAQIYGDDVEITPARIRANVELYSAMECGGNLLKREVERDFRRKRRGIRGVKSPSQPEMKIHIVR